MEIYNYFTQVYPYYTYQRLLQSADFHPKEAYPGSSYRIAAYDCFLFLHNKNDGMDCKLYSKNKVNINIGDMTQLAEAWNTIVPILTAHDSIIMQIKVVVPEWVERIYSQREMEKSARDRRMSGAQIILYIYYKSEHHLVIDYDAYIKCLRSIERAFTLTQVTPPASSFVPVNDIKIGKYFSMHEDVAGFSGDFLPFDFHKGPSSSSIIEEFKKRLIPPPSLPFFNNNSGSKEEKKEQSVSSDPAP